MKYETATIFLAFLSTVSAAPSRMPLRREVPQEHSHEQFLATLRTLLNKNNPQGIVDPVFGLLGNTAAAKGLGKTTDVNCLQQATADQAFTNAKAASDVPGMTTCLIYRALERNTPGVGVASAPCTSVKAVNPEIATVSQHQDPASPGAAATNKAVVLELAKQISSIGGNPQDALKSGTFKPGNTADTTGKGNTCDDQNDPVGCIFTQNLLVEDATAAEINAAVAGGAAATAPATAAPSSAPPPATTPNVAGGSCPKPVIINALPPAVAPAAAPTTTPASTNSPSGSNVQTFTGTLGGLAPPVIFTQGAARPFSVDNSTFINKGAALQRSCATQHNNCANSANSGKLAGGVGQCDTQQTACNAAK